MSAKEFEKENCSLHCLLVLIVLLCGFSVFADVKLPAIISDNMVLQRGKPIRIWGWARTGETVQVFLNNQHETISAVDGRWQVQLQPMKAGGPYELKITGRNELLVKNVMVGEVWLCSGQSNMELRVSNVANADTELANADFPNIRLFHIAKTTSDKPKDDVNANWMQCGPQTVADFSGVGYFFGRELHENLDVCVGLIESAWAGTAVQCWTSLEALNKEPAAEPFLRDYDRDIKHYDQNLIAYNKRLEEWKNHQKSKPSVPRGPGHFWAPAAIYNAMVAPVLGYGMKGIIWYQGESNTRGETDADKLREALSYRYNFINMINDWRARASQGKLSFYFVQLANYSDRKGPYSEIWAYLRDSQAHALSLSDTGMAVILDKDPGDLHPPNKQEVGRRLALIALAKDYSKNIVCSGPVYEAMVIDGKRAVLSFNMCGSTFKVTETNELMGFLIAGPNKKFVKANAAISGDKIVVFCESVPNPVAVRYAWGANAEVSLFNKEGLPVPPFRTDDWHELNLIE